MVRRISLNPLITNHSILSRSKVEFVHCPEVVGMEEKPIAGIKAKKKSSMSLHCKHLKMVRLMHC